MIKNLLEDKIIIHSEQPFYSYSEGGWTRGNNTFSYVQTYSRGSGNPLSNFIQNGTRYIDNFLYSYFKTYGIIYNGITENFRNEILQFFTNYYNEFMDNKYIIDTTKHQGEYVYDGGMTTGQINLNTAISIINKREYQYKKNHLIQKNNYYTNPQYIYKLVVGSISSERW